MHYLPGALQAGLSISDFWNSTLDEIECYIKAYNEKVKSDITLSYLTAKQTAQFIGLSLNGKEIPSLYESYPSLFTAEAAAEVEAIQLEIMKEQMLAFADGRNRQIDGG